MNACSLSYTNKKKKKKKKAGALYISLNLHRRRQTWLISSIEFHLLLLSSIRMLCSTHFKFFVLFQIERARILIIMSYEEIDKALYKGDVFTQGAEGRYAKAKESAIEPSKDAAVKKTEKKKNAPRVDATDVDETTASMADDNNNETVKVSKSKKTSRTKEDNGATVDEQGAASTVDGTKDEKVTRPKKTRKIKVDNTTDSIDPVSSSTLDEPIKPKKVKTPKESKAVDDLQNVEISTTSPVETSVETSTKVKKIKKAKQLQTSVDPLTEPLENMSAPNTETTYSSSTTGIYCFK
jgi:hypothetical protein